MIRAAGSEVTKPFSQYCELLSPASASLDAMRRAPFRDVEPFLVDVVMLSLDDTLARKRGACLPSPADVLKGRCREVDRKAYPRFDNSVRLAAKQEVFETIGHLLRTNGSLRDLLSADYCVVNSVLARFYGIAGVAGDDFRPVSLPLDSLRGGLSGMAAKAARRSSAGRGAGIKLGQSIVMPTPTPLCHAWLTLLKGSGVDWINMATAPA